MGELERVLGCVDAFYEAALREQWDGALHQLKDLLGGVATSIELHDVPGRRVLFFESTDLITAGIDDYLAYFHTVCPRVAFSPAGAIEYDYRFLGETEMDRDEFYADFLSRWDLRYYIAGTVIGTADRYGVVAVHRTPAAGHVSPQEIARLRLLMPHVQRAMQLRQRLRAATEIGETLADALDRLQFGVAVVEGDGTLRYCNQQAERMCASPANPLAIVRRRLSLDRPADNRQLRRLIRSAVDVEREPHGSGGTMLARGGASLLSLLVAPAAPCVAEPLWSDDRRVALVFAADPARAPQLAPAALRALYQLTEAEAELAIALAGGISTRTYADQRGVTINTVRTQLAAVRSKLGARSQADVVRRVLQAIPSLAG